MQATVREYQLQEWNEYMARFIIGKELDARVYLPDVCKDNGHAREISRTYMCFSAVNSRSHLVNATDEYADCRVRVIYCRTGKV